jgi:hypothetical protein
MYRYMYIHRKNKKRRLLARRFWKGPLIFCIKKGGFWQASRQGKGLFAVWPDMALGADERGRGFRVFFF